MAEAVATINEMAFIDRMGGYLQARAVPLPEKHRFLLAMLGESRANKELSKGGGGGSSSSDPGLSRRSGIQGVGDAGGWTQRNRTEGIEPEMGRDPRMRAG